MNDPLGTATSTAALAAGTPSLGAPATLGGEASVAAPAPDAAANPNVFTFKVQGTETEIAIDISQIPAEVRLDGLKKYLRDYVTNAVNQVNVRTNKDNAPFDAYDEAVKADPLQTAVAKPEGERKVADLLGTAAAARERLYKGEVKKAGDGSSRRETVDPLTKIVTDAVVKELFQKEKDSGGKRKYVEFTSEVSKAGGGIKYLEAKIAEKVAQGADKSVLEKFMDERYIKPAQMLLGTKTNKATDPANSIL